MVQALGAATVSNIVFQELLRTMLEAEALGVILTELAVPALELVASVAVELGA